MACFYPIPAFQLGTGEVRFVERGDVRRAFFVPCGQCIGCRLERSRQWGVRCMHEASMHESSCFITLTYDDANLASLSLCYRDFQLFMKRLRKSKGAVRFYMCGEYGETYGRPHFHACLFNCFFPDRELFKRSAAGCDVFTSAELSKLWPFGFASVGDVTFESACYVARYIMKKITGAPSEAHYECIDGDTGEIVQRVPEFNRMSLKPGIGCSWFEKYRAEVFERDEVIVNGMKCKPPKYYKSLLSRLDPLSSEFVDFSRFEKAAEFAADGTPERLAVREIVTKARLSFKSRSLS